MPELPEVETIRRQLNRVIVGQRIKGLQGQSLSVKGKKILKVRRKAKMIIIDLSGGDSLWIHLKMTGQLVYKGQKTKHTRAIFQLSKGKLFFNDLRRFGWIKLMKTSQLEKQLALLPPDVVDKRFTPDYLKKILAASARAVKLVLMDQQKLGGVGNIYANEALYCARINPRQPAKKLKEVKKLYHCLKRVISQGIKYGGSTASDDNYANAFGKKGTYQEYFLIYERGGEKCRRPACRQAGAVIKKIKLGGRGTYFCPGCQL